MFLPVRFRLRETFAYSCEFYSAIIARSKTKADRIRHLSMYRRLSPCLEDYVDANEVDAILEQAVNARNGLKTILKRCAQEQNGVDIVDLQYIRYNREFHIIEYVYQFTSNKGLRL